MSDNIYRIRIKVAEDTPMGWAIIYDAEVTFSENPTDSDLPDSVRLALINALLKVEEE